MTSNTVERSIWIQAPVERVWSAITEPAQLGQWLLPPSMGAQLQQTGSRLAISMGPMSVELAAFEASDRPRRVTLRGQPDGQLAVTFALAEDNGGTRVTVTVSGFDALPGTAGQERMGPTGAGWQKALQNLKAFVDGAELPFPEGWNAALFGYRRGSAKTYGMDRSIWIKAPVERVWTAITEPEQIGKWFAPGMEWRGSGPVVGGVLSVYDPATKVETPLQIIDVVEPNQRLVTHSTPESTEKTYVTEWTLSPENGGTRLTLSYSGFDPNDVDSQHDMIEQNTFGFGMMMENLKAGIEGGPLPYPGGF